VLAERNGQPVGFALTIRSTAGEYAQLIRVAIHPAAQGQGIGRQLVVDAIAYARENDTPGLSLNTQVSNIVSRRLYESLGFHATGPSVAVMAYHL
jgi:ribosomal protein S18 acetylase RimI-like enzyme